MLQELKVDVAEVRAQMGRANVNQTRLAELSGVHRNTIAKILKNQTADLESIAGIARGLNEALRAEGFPEINPFDLLKPVGFPAPQMVAPAAMNRPMFS
jgi:transcriptional regulator with XRE-family HTH domain